MVYRPLDKVPNMFCVPFKLVETDLCNSSGINSTLGFSLLIFIDNLTSVKEPEKETTCVVDKDTVDASLTPWRLLSVIDLIHIHTYCKCSSESVSGKL